MKLTSFFFVSQELVNVDARKEQDSESKETSANPLNDPDDVDIDNLFEEMQKKRKALPKDTEELEQFVEKKSKKKRKLDKLKAKRKLKQEQAEKEKKQEFKEDFIKFKSDSGESGNENEGEEEATANEEEEGIIRGSLTRKRTLEDLEGDWSDENEVRTGDGAKTVNESDRSRTKKKRKRKKKSGKQADR